MAIHHFITSSRASNFMQSYALPSILFLVVWDSGINGKESRPGICKTDAHCTAKAPLYACVSVQTTRPQTRDVKQCLPNYSTGDICTGKTPGRCPSFSTWPKGYKSISPVCAYINPKSKCNTEDGQAKANSVDCIFVPDDSGENVGVIYGCVDYSIREKRLLFEKNSKADKLASKMEYPDIIMRKCLNPTAMDVICSGRGTCMPDGPMSMNYSCGCNVGYEGKYCENIDSNRCMNEGQCAAGTCNLKRGQCECTEGTIGNQCAYCDALSPKSCSGNGNCVMAMNTAPKGMNQYEPRFLQKNFLENIEVDVQNPVSTLRTGTAQPPQFGGQKSLSETAATHSNRVELYEPANLTSSNQKDVSKPLTVSGNTTASEVRTQGETATNVDSSKSVPSGSSAGDGEVQGRSKYAVKNNAGFTGTGQGGMCTCKVGWAGSHCDRSTISNTDEPSDDEETPNASPLWTTTTALVMCISLNALLLS